MFSSALGHICAGRADICDGATNIWEAATDIWKMSMPATEGGYLDVWKRKKLPLSESEKRRQLFKSVFSVWLHVNLFLKDNTLLEDIISNLIGGTVIPAMVQRLRFSINVQHLSHKFAFDNSQAVPAVKIPVGAVVKNT